MRQFMFSIVLNTCIKGRLRRKHESQFNVLNCIECDNGENMQKGRERKDDENMQKKRD